MEKTHVNEFYSNAHNENNKYYYHDANVDNQHF